MGSAARRSQRTLRARRARTRTRTLTLPPQVEFIKNEDYKYVRLLGAFYLRLVGKPLDVYQYLEVRRARFWRAGAWAQP